MTTLALDLGQNIGWVKGRITGPMEHGTFKLPNTTDLGRWLRGADEFCRQVFPGVTSIAMEQPFLGSDYYPARKLIALLGHCHYWASFYDVRVVQEIAVGNGKLNLAGHGHADEQQMISAAMRVYGLDVDEHAAHALGIWDVFMFGKREPIRKPKSRSSKPVVIKP